MQTKRCTKCKTDLPLSEFSKCQLTKSGLQSWCKTCTRLLHRAYYHTEAGQAWFAAYSSSEAGKAVRRRFAESEYRKAYRDAYNHSERGRVTREKYRRSEKARATAARFRQTDTYRAIMVRYKGTEKDRARSQRGLQKRRTLETGLPFHFTDAMRRVLLHAFDNRCAYCRVELTGVAREPTGLHWDHLIPLSRQDVPNPGTVWDNMVPACCHCNDSKFNRTHREWCTAEQLVFIDTILASLQS